MILRRAYKSGREAGDLENALLAFSYSNLYLYDAGCVPLPMVRELTGRLEQQIQEFRADPSSVSHSQLSLLISYLSGEKCIDWASLEEEANSSGEGASKNFRLIWVYWSRLQLGYHFGNLSFAERMLQKFLIASAEEHSYITVSIGLFFSGLIATGLARQTGLRKYRQRTHKVLKRINFLVHSRGLIMLHRGLIIEAENASILRDLKKGDIKAAYDKAITAASRAGFIQVRQGIVLCYIMM